MILDCLLQITSLKRRGDILSNAFSHRRLKLLGCRAFIDQPSFDFSTGIQTEWDTFVRMENHRVFHSHCPHCKSEHSWRPEDAKIVTAVHRNEIIALGATSVSLSQRAERSRLRGWPQRRDRIPVPTANQIRRY
jgi:hypothetical protein